MVSSFYSKYYLLIEKIHSSTDLLHPIVVQKCGYRLKDISSRVNRQVDLWTAGEGLQKGESYEQL